MAHELALRVGWHHHLQPRAVPEDRTPEEERCDG